MWWTRASLSLVGAAAAAMTVGCSPEPSAVASMITDKVYTVVPDSVTVESGGVAGEILRMRVTERIEQGSGRITSPAKLSGRLFLQNLSADQAIRLIGATISYLDAEGQPIRFEGDRAEPTIRFGSSNGASGRLDPGQSATELLDAEFPVEALKTKKLKDIEIRLELSNVPAVPRVEMLKFAVSIGGQ